MSKESKDAAVRTVQVDQNGNTVYLSINLSAVSDSRSATAKIALATPEQLLAIAAECLESMYSITNSIGKIKQALVETTIQKNQRRAELLSDEIPNILKAKGLVSARSPSGSEDQRSALLVLDERLTELTSIEEDQRGVLSFLETSYKNAESSARLASKALDLHKTRRTTINPNETGYSY